MTDRRSGTLHLPSLPTILFVVALAGLPACGDPATPVSFSWSVHGSTSAEASVTCNPTNCPSTQSCNQPPPDPGFSQSGSTLDDLSTSLQAGRSCSASCQCCLPNGINTSSSAQSDVQILADSSAAVTQWSLGGQLSANMTVSGPSPGDTCFSAGGSASSTAEEQWEVVFDTGWVSLFFSRSHFVNASNQGVAGTSTITLTGPVGTVFTQTLTRSTPGGSNGSGSLQTLLRPGRYTFTIQSQIGAAATFPPSTGAGGQSESRCFLRFTPCPIEIDLHVSRNASLDTELSWTVPPNATSYDVVRGDVASLIASGGNFTVATTECLANNSTNTSMIYQGVPDAGEAFWFLVRAAQCGGLGSYDSGFLSQVGSRDAEIDASSGACSP